MAQIGLWVWYRSGIYLVKGTNLNEASRWITIPIINQTFQSSDLAKLALIMYVARMLARKQEEIKSFSVSSCPSSCPLESFVL